MGEHSEKTGRNDPCPCGSGRKFKRCCGSVATSEPQSAELARLLRTGRDHLAARRYEEAVGALLRAAQLAPDRAALFADLGKACLFTQRLPEAVQCLRRSIALQPGEWATHQDLGHALHRSGDLAGALTAHRRALEFAPVGRRTEVHGRVGDLLLALGRPEEAAAAYEGAREASPGTTAGRLAGAKATLLLRPRGAEEQLRDLLARDPSSAEAHLVLGLVLSEAGRFDEAGASFERSLALAPGQATAHHGLVATRRMTEADRPVVSRILARLEGTDLAGPQRMTLHFAAGKALDDLGEYSAAMQQFDAANALRGQLSAFDPRDFERRVDGILARFTRDFFTRHARLLEAPGEADETPVLVLGMPRSGTTLIERILSSHPSVAGGGELGFWNDHAPALIAAPLEELLAKAPPLRDAYRRLLSSVGPDAARVTDKMPFNFLWAGLVHALFPRARIVHCRRSPLDTCLSIYQTHFAQHWGFASDRSHLVAYYRQYLRLMDHWRAVLPVDRFIDVDYEEATGQPESTARRLIAFCGLPWDPSCLLPERNTDAVRTASKWQARQPIYKSSVERWRHYEPWLGALRELGAPLPSPPPPG